VGNAKFLIVNVGEPQW